MNDLYHFELVQKTKNCKQNRWLQIEKYHVKDNFLFKSRNGSRRIKKLILGNLVLTGFRNKFFNSTIIQLLIIGRFIYF